MRIRTHAIPGMQRQAVQKMRGVLDPATGACSRGSLRVMNADQAGPGRQLMNHWRAQCGGFVGILAKQAESRTQSGPAFS